MQRGRRDEDAKKHVPREKKKKKQEKTPERELNEVEVSNLPGTAFKMLVMRIPKELSESFDGDTASGKKDIETIK